MMEKIELKEGLTHGKGGQEVIEEKSHLMEKLGQEAPIDSQPSFIVLNRP
jgi:hypothetical protein